MDSSAIGVRCFPQLGQYVADGEAQTVRLPGRDGELFLAGNQGPAEFPITVRADADNQAAARTLLDGVAAWLTAGPAQLVFDELPDRYWTARLRGGLAWTLGAGSYRVKADIVMRADDPHAYAVIDDTVTLTAPGTVGRLAGNAASRPTVWVFGVLTGGQSVTLNLWGRTVVLTGPLAANEVAILDYQNWAFRVSARSTTTVRNNQLQNPVGTDWASLTGWALTPLWYGSGGTGTNTLVSSAQTLPDGSVVPGYIRKTWNTVGATISTVGFTLTRSASSRGAVTAGQWRTFQLAVRTSIATPPVQNFWQITFWSAASGGTQIGATVNGPTLSNPTPGQWTQYSHRLSVPAGATHAEVTWYVRFPDGSVAPGATLDATGAMVESASTLRPPIWGDRAPEAPDVSYVWTGTAGASTSLMMISTLAPVRNLAGKLSTLARISCPVGGGPVSWTTTGSGVSVGVYCNSRWV